MFILENSTNYTTPVIIQSIRTLGMMGGESSAQVLIPFMINADLNIQQVTLEAVENIFQRVSYSRTKKDKALGQK